MKKTWFELSRLFKRYLKTNFLNEFRKKLCNTTVTVVNFEWRLGSSLKIHGRTGHKMRCFYSSRYLNHLLQISGD